MSNEPDESPSDARRKSKLTLTGEAETPAHGGRHYAPLRGHVFS